MQVNSNTDRRRLRLVSITFCFYLLHVILTAHPQEIKIGAFHTHEWFSSNGEELQTAGWPSFQRWVVKMWCSGLAGIRPPQYLIALCFYTRTRAQADHKAVTELWFTCHKRPLIPHSPVHPDPESQTSPWLKGPQSQQEIYFSIEIYVQVWGRLLHHQQLEKESSGADHPLSKVAFHKASAQF